MGHKVSIVSAKIEFEVDELDSVLDAALIAGVNLPHGCKSGNCGACKCRVVSGEVVHADDLLPTTLSSAEFADGYRLMCQSYANSDVVIDLPGFTNQLPIKTLPSKIVRIDIIGTTAVVKLQLPVSQKFEFYPGQYLDIIYKEQSRSYSIASCMNNENQLDLHIRHRTNGFFSDAVFSELTIGSIIRFKGPMGSFTLNSTSNKNLLFVCTGTGFAPIKAILDSMIETNNQRKAHLIWGNVHVADFYLTEILSTYQNQLNLDVTLCLSEKTLDGYYAGLVTDLLAEKYKDMRNYQLYACGNPKMIESAYDLARHSLHLGIDDFFSDSFTPSSK